MNYISKYEDFLSLADSRVAFFSGSFDPIHKGHVKVMQVALERCVGNVIVCVHSHNPQKKVSQLEHRMAIIQYFLSSTAIKDNIFIIDPGFMSGIENDDFIKHTSNLKNEGFNIFILKGQDALVGRDKYPLSKLDHIVINRGGKEEPIEEIIEGKLTRFDHVSNMSSTEVRKKIAQGKRIYNCDDIHEYIDKKGLYRA